MKIAVLVSGSGTNLQNIYDNIEKGYLKNTSISLVIGDRECYALDRALDYSEVEVIQLMRGKELSKTISEICENQVDYIVLAGFLSILDASFFDDWANKVINVHPSLLPKYGGKGMYGKKVHEAVLASGDKESGATVHWVAAGVDEGAILKQGRCELDATDTVESLAKKVHDIEYKILIESLKELEA